MKAVSFSHVALTVADFNRSIRFYDEVFGATLVGVTTEHPRERLQGFFGIDDPDPSLKIGWIRFPGGAVAELFEFTPGQPAEEVVWNRQGITHFSLNVRGTDRWHVWCLEKGVEIVAPPLASPKGHTFFFVKDPDGNLIELIDNKHMRPILRWLGPLGGWVFRRTMYKKWYR